MDEVDPSNKIETKLPILKTAGAAFATPYRLRKHLLKAISLPFVISVALARTLGPETDVGLVWVVQILLDLIPYTMFAVAWHRLILVGPENAAPTFVPSLTSRSWQFLTYLAILQSFLLIGPIFSADMLMPDDNAINTETVEFDFDVRIFLSELPLYVAVTLAVSLLSAPFVYLWVRFSFVFPATAVDHTHGFHRSWRETRSHGLRLTVLTYLVSTPALTAWLIWYLFIPAECPEISTIAVAVSDSVSFCLAINSFAGTLMDYGIGYVLAVLAVSLISIAFRTCTGWVPDASGSPLAPAPGNGENSGGRG